MAKRRIVFIFFYFILFLCSSCSTLKRESTPSPIAPAQDEKTKTSEIYGPQDLYGPKADEPKKEAYGPEPIRVRPLVLVFGPGLARGFSYIGILKALEEAKIPIGAIIGTEMGAIVGIFYSLSQNINEFEWSFQKLKFFHNVRSLLSKFKKTVFMDKKTEKIINQALGEKEIQQGRTPLYLVFDDLAKQNQVLFDKGKGALLARTALALPGFLAPVEIFKNILPSYNKPFPISEAK
ncbi:MAG: patatin-like phospholipase family protein, partial [Bdellovibrio sp.]|nr:patatin-like phospholipase family protein [Bdellovibrio sp.]